MNHYGLPMGYEDLGDVRVVRAQRAAFQQWMIEVPWAKAGEVVVVANGGDIAKELGLLPAAAGLSHQSGEITQIVAEATPTPAPSAVPTATAAPVPTPSPAAALVVPSRTLQILNKKAGGVLSVAYSPNGQYVATANRDGTLALWIVATGRLDAHITGSSSGGAHTGPILDTVFTTDSRLVATAGDTRVRAWVASNSASEHVLQPNWTSAGHVAVSSDGQFLAGAGCINVCTAPKYVPLSVDGSIRLWDPVTGGLIRTLGPTVPVTGMAFSPDVRVLATSHMDGFVRLWDPVSGAELGSLAGAGKEKVRSSLAERSAVVFRPDGLLLDIAGRYWNVTTRQVVGGFVEVGTKTFSPDGRLLATASDRTVQILDVTTGEVLRTLSGHTGLVTSLAFSSNGSLLVSGSEDGMARIWGASDGVPLAPSSAPTPTPTSAPVSAPTSCIPLLISPAVGDLLDNGRTDAKDEIEWQFDWTDCEGATEYDLYVIGQSASIPLINKTVADSSYRRTSQGSYITEGNRKNWTWKVRTRTGDNVGESSEIRVFDVEPVNTDG